MGELRSRLAILEFQGTGAHVCERPSFIKDLNGTKSEDDVTKTWDLHNDICFLFDGLGL